MIIMGAQIFRIDYYIPDGILSNDELERQHPEWKAGKVESKVGIRYRHIAAENETALDMAEKACEKLFQSIDKTTIDFILLCTQSPEYLLPTTACILQDRLGLRKDIGALDFNLGCSGYVYGLALAKGLIVSGSAKKVLLITSETYTKFIDSSDVSNRSIFGDAATATLVVESEREHIGEFVFGTDGSGAENLIVNNVNARNNYRCPVGLAPQLYMNGPEIFNFTIETIPKLVDAVCERNNLNHDDLSYVILHQANKYILEFLISSMGLPKEKCHIDLVNYGNTVSSTIPIALKDSWDRNMIQPNDRVLLAGFGVGYSWGGLVLNV